MRFSVLDIVLAIVPIAFGCMWLINMLQPPPIIWRDFSVDALDSARSEGATTLVLGLPYITRGFNEEIFSLFDLPEIRRIFHNGRFQAMKCHYHTFTPEPGIPERDISWLVEQVRGSYKEIVLIRVDPDGTTEYRRMFFDSNDVIDLLDVGTRKDNFSNVYAWLAICFSILFAIYLFYNRRASNPA